MFDKKMAFKPLTKQEKSEKEKHKKAADDSHIALSSQIAELLSDPRYTLIVEKFKSHKEVTMDYYLRLDKNDPDGFRVQSNGIVLYDLFKSIDKRLKS